MHFIYIIQNLIKTYNLSYEITEIKIIDNDNFNCLENYDEYVNINIKNNKTTGIIKFGRGDIKYIKYYKKSILAINDVNEIYIWEPIDKNKYQFITKITLGIYGDDISVFEQYDILLSCGFYNLCIYNLKKKKIDSIQKELELNFRAAMPFYENNILLLGGDDESNYKELNVFNIKEKKVIKHKEFDFFIYEYGNDFTKFIKYYKKKDVIILCGGKKEVKNDVFNSIYIYDRDFNLNQILEKIHYKNIFGLAIYERGINDLILSYSEDGEIFFYSIN